MHNDAAKENFVLEGTEILSEEKMLKETFSKPPPTGASIFNVHPMYGKKWLLDLISRKIPRKLWDQRLFEIFTTLSYLKEVLRSRSILGKPACAN